MTAASCPKCGSENVYELESTKRGVAPYNYIVVTWRCRKCGFRWRKPK